MATLTAEQASARGAKRGRELRTFNLNTRVEVREDGASGGLTLEGYACVTESAYPMRDWLGGYDEIVRSGAFTKTLLDQDDVRLLVNHAGIPLARTKSGTLQLREDQTGLHVLAPDLDGDSSLVRDIRSAMARGDLDEMSFAFEVIRQTWSPDFSQRDIHEVRLFDVSVVTYPANPATSVGLRSLGDLDALDDDQAREALERLQARFAPAPAGLSLAHAQALLLDL